MAVSSNLLICDLETPWEYCEKCGEEFERNNEPTDLDECARVIKQAYRIEESFHRAKGECGLADYQVRNWKGWHHHHVALCLLTLWFLTEELFNQKKRIDDDLSTSSRMYEWLAFGEATQYVQSK